MDESKIWGIAYEHVKKHYYEFCFVPKIANPAGAVKVKVHGAFSANLDSPARVRFAVGKAGKPQGCLPASFDFGCRGRCSSRQESTETYTL